MGGSQSPAFKVHRIKRVATLTRSKTRSGSTATRNCGKVPHLEHPPMPGSAPVLLIINGCVPLAQMSRGRATEFKRLKLAAFDLKAKGAMPLNSRVEKGQ